MIVAMGQVDTVNGITYIMIGDGGNFEGLVDKWQSPAPEWDGYHNGGVYGYGELKIFNRTHTKWEWKSDAPIVNDTPLDSIWFVRSDAHGTTGVTPGVPASVPSAKPSSGNLPSDNIHMHRTSQSTGGDTVRLRGKQGSKIRAKKSE